MQKIFLFPHKNILKTSLHITENVCGFHVQILDKKLLYDIRTLKMFDLRIIYFLVF